MSDLKKKLEEEIQETQWNALKPHGERGALVSVDQSLSLVDVAMAVATDDKVSIEAWMDEELVRRVSPEDMNRFNKVPEKNYHFVIIQPFVLMQELGH